MKHNPGRDKYNGLSYLPRMVAWIFLVSAVFTTSTATSALLSPSSRAILARHTQTQPVNVMSPQPYFLFREEGPLT